MIRKFVMFLLVFPGLLGCERKREEIPKAIAVSEDGAMELKVMTFNIRYENANDRGAHAWRERVIGIVRMIREEKPDVLGIQEGQHGQVADLRASLGDYEFFGKGRTDGKRKGEYAGIFYRRNRFEKDEDESGMIWLSSTPDVPGSMTWGNGFPRIATWLRLTDRTSGRALRVVNMHLDHRNQESREKGVELMSRRMAEMNHVGDPVVWMGDFNAVEGNPALGILESGTDAGPMVNTFDALHPGARKRGTLHFWMSDPNRQWKVDHIYVTKGAEVLGSGVLRSGEPYLSDHFPVWARVKFGAGK